MISPSPKIGSTMSAHQQAGESHHAPYRILVDRQ